MLSQEYRRMFENEDAYWWFVSRRELVLRLVGRLGLSPDPLLLDIGCGTGATARGLERFGRVLGIDFSPEALACCQSRGLGRLARARGESLPLPDDAADVIVATDILEHIEDDRAALREFLRVLKPGGHAVVTVPAYRFLWGEHDVALMHHRRYVAGEVRERARAAGFEVAKLSYALCFLMPLALVRLLKKKPRADRPPEAQIVPVPPWVNRALIRFQRWEAKGMEAVNYPWGLSVAAVLRKPERG